MVSSGSGLLSGVEWHTLSGGGTRHAHYTTHSLHTAWLAGLQALYTLRGTKREPEGQHPSLPPKWSLQNRKVCLLVTGFLVISQQLEGGMGWYWHQKMRLSRPHTTPL